MKLLVICNYMNQKNFYSILSLVSFIFFLWSFTPQENDAKDFSQKVKIILREVGNKLLLENKDSTSLILPIVEITENKFEISFEKKLGFEPSQLVKELKENLEKSSFSKNYRVEVLQCLDKSVAYSYEINEDLKKTIIPCAGRVLPIKCYTIQIQFLEDKPLKNVAFFYILIPIFLIILYRFIIKKKDEKTIKNHSEKQTNLGSFIFYPEQNKLVKKAKEIPLSKKECELLSIFIANGNQVVKREELTKKVWEDNGVIVGRSLDTYVSKLRKKLQEDSSIKLTNIHGVGYKLEIKK